MMMEEIKNDIYKLKRHQVDGPLSGFFGPIETVSLERAIEIIDKYSDGDESYVLDGLELESDEEKVSESDETDGIELVADVIQDYYKAQMRLIKVLMMKVKVEDEDEE